MQLQVEASSFDIDTKACIIITMILKGRYQILKGYQNNHVTIGFGSYGQVKLAKDLQNGSVVAVKVIHKIAKNQVMMHHGLSHSKIIKLLDVHIDTEREITYMILEYAEEGTLYDKIKMGPVGKADVKKYFKDICEGLAYLHAQNIMHRDIKPQNILITKANEAKLCDFGFAAMQGERKTLCGTYEYMSPEMIQNRPYDYKIDVWALGILLFELIAGNAPFRGDKPQEVLEQMKTKIFFSQRFEQEDINMVKMILRVTPSKRPEVQEILGQSYFNITDNYEKSSTTNTEDSKNKVSSLQFLNESCNPKKIAELQKILDKQQHKQTYPPFYVPKQNKIGLAASTPFEDSQGFLHSPTHHKGHSNLGTANTTSQTSNKNNLSFFPSSIKTFPANYPESKPTSSQNIGNTTGGSPQQVHFFNPNKTTLGYGRFS